MSKVVWLGEVEWLGEVNCFTKCGWSPGQPDPGGFKQKCVSDCLAQQVPAAEWPAATEFQEPKVPDPKCLTDCENKWGIASGSWNAAELAKCVQACKTDVPSVVQPPIIYTNLPQAETPKTCGPNEILVNGACVPAPQITTPPATPAASEKKTPWGLILGGAALVGAAAWAMGVFGGGLVAENPSEHRAHPTKYKVSVRQHGSSQPSRTWGPFDTKEEAISFIEQKRDEARKNGWNVVFSLLEPTENWGSSGPLRPSGWGRDNPRSETWKLVPKTIGSVDHSTGKFYPNAPVTRVEAFPPGKHPPSAIRKDVTLVMIHTPYGVRQYGFADAFIDSSLRMRVKLSPGQERDEVVARWPSARGGRAG